MLPRLASRFAVSFRPVHVSHMMQTRFFCAPFAADVEARTVSAVKEFLRQREAELRMDLDSRGDSVSEKEREDAKDFVMHLNKPVTPESSWKDFRLDGLDEVECKLLIEDEFEIRLGEDKFLDIKTGKLGTLVFDISPSSVSEAVAAISEQYDPEAQRELVKAREAQEVKTPPSDAASSSSS